MATWIIDPDHSVAAFSLVHMMIAHVRGQFNTLVGKVSFDPENIVASSVELTIAAAGVYTGIRKRDDHLRSPDFFDAEKYPTIVFKSVAVGSVSGNRAVVDGDLTIRGITHRVSVETEFRGPVKDPLGDGMSMGFRGFVAINREEYGMTWNQPMEDDGLMLGKEVTLVIDLEADLASA